MSEPTPPKLSDAIPTNWLDSLLTGPSAVIGKPPYTGTDIERLLSAIRARVVERETDPSPAARPQEEKTQYWSVSVERNGQSVVTIESNCLSGRDLSAEDARVIRMAAEHLRSFVGTDPVSPAVERPTTANEGGRHATDCASTLTATPMRPCNCGAAVESPSESELRTAVATVLDKFTRDEAQGYHNRDRQYAITVLGRALSAGETPALRLPDGSVSQDYRGGPGEGGFVLGETPAYSGIGECKCVCHQQSEGFCLECCDGGPSRLEAALAAERAKADDLDILARNHADHIAKLESQLQRLTAERSRLREQIEALPRYVTCANNWQITCVNLEDVLDLLTGKA